MENLKSFMTKRIVIGVLIAIVALWLLAAILEKADNAGDRHSTASQADVAHQAAPEKPAAPAPAKSHDTGTHAARSNAAHPQPQHSATPTAAKAQHDPQAVDHAPAAQEKTGAHTPADDAAAHARKESAPAHTAQAPAAGHDAPAGDEDGHGEGHGGLPFPISDIPGVNFVQAALLPLENELHGRAWGWRPNDLINVTDNVNSFQLGVLEVTRRTAVVLSERLSRTGITAALDENLENATNWLMIKPNRYWFPSAESKYSDSLDEIRIYLERLEKGEARFYTRSDNLIPLLSSYVELLGSCDENLAKHEEEDGTPVSYFKADDYFFYTQGVASSLHTILQAIAHDFAKVIETRRGAESLHHAILSCHHAMVIDPWLILESDLDSVFANHRANMAAPISHAGFYLRVLITTLST